MKLLNIADGIEGLFVENQRFSTTHISVNLYLPLKKDTLAANALLPYILSSCCEKYPDFSALNLRLSELYGAEVGGVAEKIGDTQVLRFFCFSINDDLALQDINIVEQACSLLLSMLFEPSLNGKSFFEHDVERERRLTLEKIEGLANDKRSYAIYKALSIMYANEPFGEMKTGSTEDVAALTGEQLYNEYINVISSARVRIQVIGKKMPDKLFSSIAQKFSNAKRRPAALTPSVAKAGEKGFKTVEEPMEVTQGKLVMGFCTNVCGTDRETAAFAVFADLFGGGPYSKLFLNVREKLSLCYYCAARANRSKGYLLVDSGVEPQNSDRARDEILRQFELMKQGDFSEDDLKTSVRSIRDSLMGLNDSQSILDAWYSLKLFEEPLSPEEYISLIELVTKADVINAAGSYKLDTVYKIVPQEVNR